LEGKELHTHKSVKKQRQQQSRQQQKLNNVQVSAVHVPAAATGTRALVVRSVMTMKQKQLGGKNVHEEDSTSSLCCQC